MTAFITWAIAYLLVGILLAVSLQRHMTPKQNMIFMVPMWVPVLIYMCFITPEELKQEEKDNDGTD